ncbi:hypothetical protein PV10_02031 [Exophiala mesophila]|uniref:J domain-containing protein n=1 Tax=Exophiala mesophila TaxID=212818 RepID=A0A0D1ZHZ7_EXOME|nr:uncharacterized protein PV10_02031 [Exophiala mesophila]KIV94247.1 hypothetical protein PV10_02031 [Exophiala mesophila]
MAPRVLHVVLLVLSLTILAAAWSKEDYEIFKVRDELESAEGPDVTFYDFLGVQPSATVDEILKAFRKKSRALHPDKVVHSFTAARSTGKPRKPGEKKKPGVHVSSGPSERELRKFLKQANERYTRLGVVRDILKGPDRERYDFFMSHGFPTWRGTGYYYSRYRPGLGTVLVGLFLFGGGAAHYFVLVTSYKRQRDFMERYIRHARKTAWGDELGMGGIAGLGQPVEMAQVDEEPDPAANLNRRQKRELERQNKKEAKPGKNKSSKPAPIQSSTGSRDKRRVTAENGKTLVVDSVGNVFLEEEDEEGEVQEYLLDLDEIQQPSFRDTAVVRLPVYLWRKAFDPFLKRTDPVPSDELFQAEAKSSGSVTPDMKSMAAPTDLSSSQISDSGFEIVDKDTEFGNTSSGVKKRSKKEKSRK